MASNVQVGKQVKGKHGKKQLALTLASVYHPCTMTGDDKTYLCFLDTLDPLLNQLPEKSEIIMGVNINSNIGTIDDLYSAKFCSVLRPHGLPKRNKKGNNLLQVYLAHRLRIMNTFYETRTNSLEQSTWTSNPPTSSGIADSHMLDAIVCSMLLHNCIHNFCTILDGLDSDHRAVRMDLNLTSINYKANTLMNCGDIEWRKICEEDEKQKLFNKYLLKLTSWDMSYDNFCKAVICAGKETSITINWKCKGWYTTSKKHPSASHPREELIAPPPPQQKRS